MAFREFCEYSNQSARLTIFFDQQCWDNLSKRDEKIRTIMIFVPRFRSLDIALDVALLEIRIQNRIQRVVKERTLAVMSKAMHFIFNSNFIS